LRSTIACLIIIRIKFKYLFGLLLVFGLYSCSDDPPEQRRNDKYFGPYYQKKYSQISIENGPRQGFQYNSKGTEYNYRYITTTITNDSLVPFRLRISFFKEYKYLRDRNILKSKVFLLPRKLTPERQHFDKSMSKELKSFLDRDVDVPICLDTIIHPNERIVMTFAVLTDEKYGEFNPDYALEKL
jgi:hypothetical protein